MLQRDLVSQFHVTPLFSGRGKPFPLVVSLQALGQSASPVLGESGQGDIHVPVGNSPRRQCRALSGCLCISSPGQGLSLEQWGTGPGAVGIRGSPEGSKRGSSRLGEAPLPGRFCSALLSPGELQGAPFGALLAGPREMGFSHSHVSPWPHFGSAAPCEKRGSLSCWDLKGFTSLIKDSKGQN